MARNAARRSGRDRAAGVEAAGDLGDRRHDTAAASSAAMPRPRPFDRMGLDDRLDWLIALDDSGRLNEIEAVVVHDALRRLKILPRIRLPARRLRILDHLIRRHRAEEPRR